MNDDIRSVDLFAGGGGASEGIRLAVGKAPLVAINHDQDSITMHAMNHPGTMHLCKSVFDVDPFLPHGKPLDLLWASPDCTHFSRAKGGKPRKKEIRDLAWVVAKWAALVGPRVIAIENVPEFVTWGPLDDEGRIIKSRKGETFQRFVKTLEDLGYKVEWKTLIAADYGAPTTRKRLFLIARCDDHLRQGAGECTRLDHSAIVPVAPSRHVQAPQPQHDGHRNQRHRQRNRSGDALPPQPGHALFNHGSSLLQMNPVHLIWVSNPLRPLATVPGEEMSRGTRIIRIRHRKVKANRPMPSPACAEER